MKRPAARRATRRGLAVSIESGVAWMRLERAAAGNRITAWLAQALCDAAADIELDDEVHVVVVSAAGRDFCLGVEGGGGWQEQIDWVDAIGRLSCPVVAVIQGDAIAEGCELALACDLRLCADNARFGLPQLQETRLPAHGATQRLPRLVGRTRALDLLLTGRLLGAREALRWGLASQLAAPGRLPQAARRLVAELRRNGPRALRYAKEAVVKGSDMTLEQGMRLEQDLYVLLQTSRDRREGVMAFRRKRPARFRGE